MTYISEIFERLDIQQIREFLLHGVDEMTISNKTYFERLKSAEKIATGTLHARFPCEEDYEKVTDDVFTMVTATQNVYMEIGMQCGAAIAMQLLGNPKTE